jgi:D-alanyl-D-alanine carboxypeptidase/D-alanyl-D-alanine-endopeptidase (penicillin-binding protein 4)
MNQSSFPKHPIRLSFLVLVTLPFLLAACGGKKEGKPKAEPKKKAEVQVDTALRHRLDDFAHRRRVNGKFAFYVYDLTANKRVYGYNEKQSVPSASCLKLLTGVAGLHLLGTDYLYRTSIYTRGTMKADTLKGDVVFRAGLDPQLNGPDLSMFPKALRRKGIRKIDGHLVLNLVISEPVKSEQHWYPWDLSFSRYGVLYKGEKRIRKELLAAFRGQGFHLRDSQVVRGPLLTTDHCVFRYYRGIEKVIARMWKNSSNTQATSLLYTIGHRVDPKGSPTAAGVQYLRTFLRDSLGQKEKNLVIHDGCGLCTYNRLSPKALVAVLHFGYDHRDIYGMLMRNLSISGVDGTLRREMAGPKTRGKVHAKTGTLSHPYGISSLAGYCQGSNGHDLAFAIMDSEMSVLDARVLQTKLCEALVK